MSRHQKTNKRAASRRRHSPTSSLRRPSHTVTAAPLVPPASITPAHTRAAVPLHAQAAPTTPLPATVPAHHTSPLSHTPQQHQGAHEHRDRRAHPDQAALQERAFALACIGHRSPAIAAQLGVSERTIRHWNSTTLRTLALDATGLSSDLDSPADRDRATSPTAPAASASKAAAPAPDTSRMEYHRALAIERQLDIAVTARAAYDRLMAQHDHLLAQFIAASDVNIAATASSPASVAAVATDGDASPAPPLPAAVTSMARLIPQLASSASRQLQIAQAAHREVARLQGVTTYAQTDARLSAEYDVRQAQHAAAPAEEQVSLVPLQFIDTNPEDDDPLAERRGHVPQHRFDFEAALEDICGPFNDKDEEDDATATSAPTQNAPSLSASAATSPATATPGSAIDSGKISGNKIGNDSGNKIGNDSGNITGTHQSPLTSPRGPFPQGKGAGG